MIHGLPDNWIKQEFTRLQEDIIQTFTAGGTVEAANTTVSNGGFIETGNTTNISAPSRVGEVLVVDIYHGDNVQDFAKTKAAGVVGVIHKASQGGKTADLAYATRRKLATAQGLLWGAYHFFDLSADGKTQADHFLSMADADSNTLVALDWETIGKTEPTVTQVTAFLEEVETKLGRKAMIYSGNVAKEQLNGIKPYFSSHRLWLCQYGKIWKTQASWNYPWLWQNNGDSFGPGPHTIPGIEGLVDNNTIVSPMTVTRLRDEWAS